MAGFGNYLPGGVALDLPARVAGASPIASARQRTLDAQGLTSKSASWVALANGSDMFSDLAEETPVAAESGGDVARIKDLSGNGLDLDRVSASARRAIATDGLTCGSADTSHYSLPMPGGTGVTSMTLFMLVKTTDTRGVFARGIGTSPSFILFLDDGQSATIHYDVRVDGVLYPGTTERDAFHSVVADGNWHILEVIADFEDVTELEFFTASLSVTVWKFVGACAAISLNSDSELDAIEAGKAATARTDAREWYSQLKAQAQGN